MTSPHDFEFRFGKNHALKGRGWRGLLALGLVLTACVTIATGSGWVVSPIRTAITYLELR